MSRCCIVLLSAFLALAGSLSAADRIGDITYLEGDVTVMRNDQELDGVQTGLDIENFDLVKTGADGLAEAEIAASATQKVTVKVAPSTLFTLEISKLGAKQKTSVGIISGTISLKVAKLAGAQSVSVKTDSAVMGVRGTQFSVTSPPTGDILVTCDEGEVSCTDEQGKEATAAPGTVVEKRADEVFRTLPVEVSSLETFRKKWHEERIEALKSHANAVIRNLARRYNGLYREFNRNYAALMKEQAIIAKWREEDRKGRVGGSAEMMKEKKALIGHLFALRKTLFLFERVYFRLLAIKGYHDQGFGKGDIDASQTTTQFFQKLAMEKKDLERKMAMVRYIVKLYAKRNEGEVPTDAFGGDGGNNEGE